MIVVSASSWRIITAGIPRPAWRTFSKARLYQPLIAHLVGDHPDVAIAVAMYLGRGPNRRDLAQAVAQPIDTRECSKRVVDGR